MDDDNFLIYWYLNGVKLNENRQEINSERTHIASKDTIKLHMYYILVHLNITDLALMDLEQTADFEVRCTGTYKDSLISSDGKFSTSYEAMKSFPYSKEPNENMTASAKEPCECISPIAVTLLLLISAICIIP